MILKARILQTVIEWPYASEWMVGRSCKVLEEFPEDGHPMCLIHMKFPHGPSNIILPAKYLEVIEEIMPRVVSEQKLEADKPLPKPKCHAKTRSGKPCRGAPLHGTSYCAAHSKKQGVKVGPPIVSAKGKGQQARGWFADNKPK